MSIQIDLEIYKKLPTLKEVTTSATFTSTKNEIFHPQGLYSEQIFGPVKDYQCQCGALFGTINKGRRCPNCGVLCDKSDLRSTTFAKIVLPNDIYIVNPLFAELLMTMMGQYAIKSILSKKDIDGNIDDPYFFSLEKMKLLKRNKMKKNENYLDIEVYDISTLKQAYDELIKIDEVKEYFIQIVSNPDILDFIFLNEIIVTPPNSRPLIKLNKILLHRITNYYLKLINSLKNISDSLYQANTKFFGYTVYKYQDKVNMIYEEILENNFTKKESYMRESLIGKTIEFSSRAVIIPNPALKPYTIGIHKEVAQRLFLPEMLHYFFKKYKHENPDDFTYKAYQLIEGEEIEFNDEEFLEFLKSEAKNFKVILERQPVLFKYNTSGVKIGRIFGDDDTFKN